MPAPFQAIDRRYRIHRLLGEGMTGEVFLVESAEGRFALKLLKPFADRKLEAELLKAFRFEFAFLKDLRHPNVVRIHDFGFDEDLRRFYFTEELLDGTTLEEFCPGLAPETIGELFIQAVQGLQAIHRAGLVHGDLKASNMLVVSESSAPRVKIIDFGISDPRFPFTAGTPATMAPEKILKEPADARSDLYSLGVVFYQLFTGENPFSRPTVAETYEAHLTVAPPKLTLKNPRVPVFWNEIFAALLAKNPAHRYRDCGELLAAVDFARPAARGGKSARPWSPERWVGRPELLESLAEQVHRALRAREEKRRAVLLVGEAGVGKSRLAQELKYRLQMEGVKVLKPPERPADLWILDEWTGQGEFDLRQNLQPEQSPGTVVITLAPESLESLKQTLEAWGFQVLVFSIPPFSREELESFVRQLSGQTKIPENFLRGLWRKTGGHPALVVSLLERLARRDRVVDDQGRWRLAIFREADFDWSAGELDLAKIDQALAALPKAEHRGRAELWLRRAEELLGRDRKAEAAVALAAAREEASALQDLNERLFLRASVYEREGLLKIREGRRDEARAGFERAAALLEDARDAGAEALRIRCQNYLAWLLCQDGQVDAAIARFLEMERRWSELPPEQQARVLNLDLGSAYLQKGDAAGAIEALQRLLPFYERVGDSTTLMKAQYNLAEAYLLAKDYAEAIRYFEQGARSMRRHRNFEFLLRAYNGLGKAYHLMGKWEEALSRYERGLELADYLEDYSSASALAQNLGSILVEQGDLAAAHERFSQALGLLRRLPEKNAYAKYLQCRAWVELADLLRRERRFAEARERAHDAEQMLVEEPSLDTFRFWVWLAFAEIARDEGDRVGLQDALAELLPLVDDEEKRARVQALGAPPVPPSPAKEPTDSSTRVESLSAAAEVEASLLGAERRLAEENQPEILRGVIHRLQERLDRTQGELERTQRSLVESSVFVRFDEMSFVSRNAAMRDLFRTVERIRDTELAVLIHGESGTGKELLARSLHSGSSRHTGPFVAVNCAAFPAGLIESELFGYRAGAFTGAVRDKAGLIESAASGTLFLDEIAELDLSLQAKLLRVLQEREVVRLGETKPRPVKFRLLCASHRKLEAEVRAGRFREDLFYRVAELELSLPPLRERPEDVAPLAERFIAQYLEEHREKDKVALGRDLLKALLEYSWPGNVRELENLIRVATALRRGPQLRLQDLPASWRERLKTGGGSPRAPAVPSPRTALSGEPGASPAVDRTWREWEELILAKALLHFELDVRKAARALECAPSKLYQRLRENRVAERREHWAADPFAYSGESLAELKRGAFRAALAETGGSAYRAARRLDVSPATVYQWTR